MQSMDIETWAAAPVPEGEVRPNTLFVYGVDYLDTEKIMEYFKAYTPIRVEWINDSCCNVVFPSSGLTMLALNSNIITKEDIEATAARSRELKRCFGYQEGGKQINMFMRLATEGVYFT